MKIQEFFDWLDDFDRPTDTDWDNLLKTAIWVVLLAAGLVCYSILFYVFAPTY